MTLHRRKTSPSDGRPFAQVMLMNTDAHLQTTNNLWTSLKRGSYLRVNRRQHIMEKVVKNAALRWWVLLGQQWYIIIKWIWDLNAIILLMFYGLVALFSNDGRSTGLIQQRVISLSCKTSFCRLSLASAEADGSGRKAAPTHTSLILLLIKTLSIYMAYCCYVQIIRFYHMSIHMFTKIGFVGLHFQL